MTPLDCLDLYEDAAFHDLEVTLRFRGYAEEPFTGGSPKQILICRDAEKA